MDGITLRRRPASAFAAAVLGLVLLLPATNAGAEIVEGPLGFAFGAGPSFPQGDAADALGTGFAAQGILRVAIPILPVKARANVTYLDHTIDDMSVVDTGHTGGETFSEGSMKSWTGLIDGQLNIFPIGPVRPYFTLGAGWANVNTQLDGGSAGGTIDHSTTQFVWGGGVGVTVGVLGLNAYGEFRVLEIDDDAGPLRLDAISLAPLTVGLTF